MADQPVTTETESGTDQQRSQSGDWALIVAWVVSVGIHVVLFATMVAIPWIQRSMGLDQEPQITATALQDIPKQPKFSMTQLESPFANERQAEDIQQRIEPEKQATALRELDRVRAPQLEIVGIGAGGGEFSKYGLHVGTGATGPQFFGLGGDARAARRIIYVVDRSGSMMNVFEDLRKELKKSIDHLRKSQKYHLIFYSTDPPLPAPPGRLVNAIRASKERTFAFIDQTYPDGMTEPIKAMEMAFELNPDLIYFLSDGDIPEAELLKQNLKDWNRDRKVRIYTIAYVSAAGRSLLEEIARDHNGAFRFVSEYELGG